MCDCVWLTSCTRCLVSRPSLRLRFFFLFFPIAFFNFYFKLARLQSNLDVSKKITEYASPEELAAAIDFDPPKVAGKTYSELGGLVDQVLLHVSVFYIAFSLYHKLWYFLFLFFCFLFYLGCGGGQGGDFRTTSLRETSFTRDPTLPRLCPPLTPSLSFCLAH